MKMEKVGDFIRKKRKDKNLTQKELAKDLGVSDKAISKWERGICCPDISLLKELSSILGVSVNELLSGEEIEELEKEKTDDVLVDSVNKYTSIEKIKRLKLWILTVAVVVTNIIFIFIMYLMYNQINGKDAMTINSIQNRYLTDNFLTWTENKDYQKIADMGNYIFNENECNLGEEDYDYICMLKELNDLGVEFISHKNINNYLSELNDISEYELTLKYKDKEEKINVALSSSRGTLRVIYFNGFKVSDNLRCSDLYDGLSGCYDDKEAKIYYLFQVNLDEKQFFSKEINEKIVKMFSVSDYY